MHPSYYHQAHCCILVSGRGDEEKEFFAFSFFKKNRFAAIALPRSSIRAEKSLTRIWIVGTRSCRNIEREYLALLSQIKLIVSLFAVHRKAAIVPTRNRVNIKSNHQTIQIVDIRVTQKSFNFASKRGLPFYFASASEGTNVVRLFDEAIRIGKGARDNPDPDFVTEVLDLLNEDQTDKMLI